MPDKEGAPRLKPHLTMQGLAEVGKRMYHPLNPDQQRKIGQMSLTDGMPIVREAPSEGT